MLIVLIAKSSVDNDALYKLVISCWVKARFQKPMSSIFASDSYQYPLAWFELPIDIPDIPKVLKMKFSGLVISETKTPLINNFNIDQNYLLTNRMVQNEF